MTSTRRELYDALDAARSVVVDIVHEAFDAMDPVHAQRVVAGIGNDGAIIGDCCKAIAVNVEHFGPDTPPRLAEHDAVHSCVAVTGEIANRLGALDLPDDLVRDALAALRLANERAAELARYLDGLPAPERAGIVRAQRETAAGEAMTTRDLATGSTKP